MLMRKLIIYTLSCLVLFVLLLSMIFYYEGWVRPLTLNHQVTSIKVHRNSSVYHVSQTMQRRGWVLSPHFVRWVAEWQHVSHLKIGEYVVQRGMTVAQLLRNMASAKGLTSYHITFIEGTTLKNFLARLQHDGNITHTLSSSDGKGLMRRLANKAEKPEGLLFPDTYHFSWGTTDVVILKMAYKKMQSILQAEWQNRAADLPYQSAYQALIAASMIQSEASLTRERPLVSSVIVNRLRRGMRLQIDPTVMYGLGMPFGSSLSRSDLKKSSPFNTYLNRGLPPTPINMPGRSSIHAALHPAITSYLYYVASGGRAHRFSINYRQHRSAVASYRKDQLLVEVMHQRECDAFRHVLLPHYTALLFWYFCYG